MKDNAFISEATADMIHEIPENKRSIKKVGMEQKIFSNKFAFHKIAKDRKVIPDPIDDRKFQE